MLWWQMKEPSPEDDELAAMEAELLTMSDDEINQKVKAIKNETKVLVRNQPVFVLTIAHHSIWATNLPA